jgi:hypothetical protein
MKNVDSDIEIDDADKEMRKIIDTFCKRFSLINDSFCICWKVFIPSVLLLLFPCLLASQVILKFSIFISISNRQIKEMEKN